MTTTAEAGVRRSLPAWGGFSPTFVGLELRRMFRNRRTVVFTLIVPAVLFLLFGTGSGYRTESLGRGNVAGYILVSMAVYAAMLATTAGGAMVSIERAAGWSRQLRLTPLRPAAYIAVKLVVAMAIGAVSVAVAFAVGAVSGAKLPGAVWFECGLLAWVCALAFAAFGLFMGYLLPSENVMQILGPVLGVLAFAGGLLCRSTSSVRSSPPSRSSRPCTGWAKLPGTRWSTRDRWLSRCSTCSRGPRCSPPAPSGGSAETPPECDAFSVGPAWLVPGQAL